MLLLLLLGEAPATKIDSVIGFMGGGSSNCSSSASSDPFCSKRPPSTAPVVVLELLFLAFSLFSDNWVTVPNSSSPLLCLDDVIVVGALVDVVLVVVTVIAKLLDTRSNDLSLELDDEGSLNNLSKPLLFLLEDDVGGGKGGGGGGRSDDLSTLLWLSFRKGGGSHLRLF